ncbi:MAG: hypothetical protein ABIN48_09595, partial [Ginsengibacter sp.]
MEKNHFEEQVQKKLAELIIQPSEKAWTGIEGRIGKKDSRKKILWLFFVGILLLAGGIVLFQTYEASQEKKMGHFSEKNNKTRVKTNSTSDTSEFTSKMADKTVVIDTAAISPYSESNNLITGIKMKIIQNNQQDIQPDGSLSADEFSNLNTPESQLLEIRFSGDLAKKEELKKLQPTLNKEENVAGLEIALPIDSFVLMNKLDEEVMIENSFPDKIKIEEIVPKDLSKQTGPSNNIKESNSTLEKWETGFSI